MISLYTDGSAKGNPGPGGYGLVLLSGSLRKELSAGYRLTTNNRMELLSVIIGLECLKKEKTSITVYSDSKYVVDAVGQEMYNEYGMDPISLGATIGAAMEMYKDGDITDADTGDIRLEWGNAEALVAMVEATGKGEGFGLELGQGSRRMCETWH